MISNKSLFNTSMRTNYFAWQHRSINESSLYITYTREWQTEPTSMVFQLMSAVALFVVIAVALYFQISEAQLLGLHTFVHSFDQPFANLMEYKFFQFMVDDTVFYIVTYIGNSVGVVVFNMTIWNRWPEVHAQAAPVVTAPVVLATVAPVIGHWDAPPAALGDPVEPVGQ